LRNWTKDKVYLREEQRGRLTFTNGAIDWTSGSEGSNVLTGVQSGGWTDPSLAQLGSCSRSCTPAEPLEKDPWVQRNQRELSFVSLDLPTSIPGKADSTTKTFCNRVIWPLVDLQRTTKDNLYSWLEVVMAFCSGKPFAYYSRYVPSPRIHAIASRHRVTLRHFPLRLLPTRLVDRNRTFRFMSLTREQWEEFERRCSDSRGTWATAVREDRISRAGVPQGSGLEL
jgi:hypothetical protein